MAKSRIIIWIIAVCIAAWWLWSSQRKEEATSSGVLVTAREIVSQVEGYDEDRERIDALVERAHEKAFSAAYRKATVGRRWRPSRPESFDADRYFRWLFIHMEQDLAAGLDSVGPSQEKADRSLMKGMEELRMQLGINITERERGLVEWD